MSKILQRISGIMVLVAVAASPFVISYLNQVILTAFLSAVGLLVLILSLYALGAWLFCRSFK